MLRFVGYDPVTGKINARLTIGGQDQLPTVGVHTIRVDDEDFDSLPEQWAEVDIEKKTLRPRLGRSDPTGKRRP